MVQRMVTSFPKIPVEQDGLCKGCVVSKQAKIVYLHSETRSKGVLDLVHFNICGPMHVTLITGSLYFATFINDYSKKTCI